MRSGDVKGVSGAGVTRPLGFLVFIVTETRMSIVFSFKAEAVKYEGDMKSHEPTMAKKTNTTYIQQHARRKLIESITISNI